eukprot:GFUD01030567.1.p1 GENE.GFUD01030567.1~~GFUD01030567.1.p1  ORF type:complete len:516 (-),score=125.26 GFUD01030567.1:65-1612(-)
MLKLTLILLVCCQVCRPFDELMEGDVATPRSPSGEKVKDSFILDSNQLWTGGVVPYKFEMLPLDDGGEEPLFSDKDKEMIEEALNHISEMVPCIQFKKVKSSFGGAHLIFSTMGDSNNYDPNRCFSYVGRQGAQGGKKGKTINLGSSGCFNLGTVLHETLHSLGATHEQNRADRGKYLKIVEENIKEGRKHNFKKKDALFSAYGTPYDYQSVMHYSADAFAKVPGTKTIIPLQPNITLSPASSKSGLSAIDTMELARVYENLTSKNCYQKETLMAYIEVLEDKFDTMEDELEQCHAKSQEKAFALLARGEAAEYQGDILGIYDPVVTSDGSTFYQQRGGLYKLYKFKGGDWYCGKTVGASIDISLYTSSLDNIGQEWKYVTDGPFLSNDNTVRFTSLSSSASSCLLCTTIRLSSTGITLTSHPEYLGLYTSAPGMFSAGRPIFYKNNLQLKIKTGYTNFTVRDEADNAVMSSASGPPCPTQGEAAHSDRSGGDAWRVTVGGEWESDTTLVVDCED